MKKYESYQQSNVLGVSQVPENWKIVNFRYLIDVLTDFTANGSFGDLAKNVNYMEEGVSRLVRLTDLRANFKNKGIYLNETSHNYLKKSELFGGEILLANVGAYAGLAWIFEGLRGKASLGPNMFLLKFKDVLDERFAYISLTSYYLHSQLLDKAKSSAQPKLNKEDVKSCTFILPTLKEQIQIVNYLDHKTKLIDDLIEKKEQLIQKLRGQRQSIINETVTKGLDPTARMKESGVDWLGEVPEHWYFNKMKRNTYMKGRIGWQGLKQDEFIDEGPYLITGMNFKNGVINWDEVYHISQERYDQAPEIQLKEGDVLMTKDGTIGKLLFVDHLPGPASLNSHLLVLRCTDDSYIPKFLYYQLMSNLFLDHIELHKTGTTFYGITQESVGKYKMLLPPQNEQREIVNHIEKELGMIEELNRKLISQINMMKDYRQSVIHEAVTGKIDVRDWEPKIKETA